MRTVYLGTSDFAVEVLERLAATPHRPELLGVQTIQPEDVNGEPARRAIAAANPEAVVICAYGALVKEPLLSDHELLNVHPSLLPRWRGAAPIERAIEAGDEETGVTIMRPVAELDAGPIAVQRAEAITSGDDYGSLSARLAALGGELLVEALDVEPPFREQPGSGITYAEKIGPEDRRLDPELMADLLERRVRALRPHIGAYVELPWDERLGVVRAALPAEEGPAPGELEVSDGRLLYGAAGGAIELCEVHPAGKRPMDAEAWVRGYGARLAGSR